MIKTFAEPKAAQAFGGKFSKKPGLQIQQRAREKLILLNAAMSILDLSLLPGNRLRPPGEHEGQWTLLIDHQWRVCFRFRDGDAFNVALANYR